MLLSRADPSSDWRDLADRWLVPVVSILLLSWGYSCRMPCTYFAASVGIAFFLVYVTRAQSAYRALKCGIGVGSLVSALALYWLPSGLSLSSGCPWAVALLLTLLASAVYGTRYALAAWGEHRAVRNGWPKGMGLLLGFVTSELISPGPIPWYLAASACDEPVLMQVAALLGPIGVTAEVLITGLFLESLLTLRHAKRRRYLPELAKPWLILVAAFLGYGSLRLAEAERCLTMFDSVRVGIAQLNIPPASTRNNLQAGVAAVRQHIIATWDLRKQGADFVLWPETAVPVAIDSARVKDLYPRLFTAELGVPALFGAAFLAEPRGFYNGAVATDRDGRVQGVYVKRRLAPFGELVPGKRWLRLPPGLFPEARGVPGPVQQEPLRISGHITSTVICFEALFPESVRKAVSADRSMLLVALANDAWFGDSWEPTVPATVTHTAESRA